MEAVEQRINNWVYGPDAFTREDDSDDAVFYERDRFVSHLDRTALDTVERIVGSLVVEQAPIILDLMAGWDSHLPEGIRPGKVVGLGLNENELRSNTALDEYVIHDLNRDPRLPFADGTFDVVVNTVSVDYLTRPFDVFRDVGRILKPGGLFLVVFSNRMFQQKAVKVWKEASEEERVIIVEDYFRSVPAFGETQVAISKGLPRPQDDKYAHLGLPSDPIYAVWAEKRGAPAGRRPRPRPQLDAGAPLSRDELARRKLQVARTLQCPYCGQGLKKWKVPQTPFTEWDNEFMYICFNDACPYLVRGWDVMETQGNRGFSYRLMYNPDRDALMPVPVPNLKALRESIVEED
ncbi:Methyltransferase domain-containing protein [Desulfacinum hydrothermale DSM 13146]|uniref:Methyltransferase domain-containing protein n=1 Tax=Desulfacinum hydrothermale DSM 13146 TaxID=1121390 RepID=A0A1W1X8E7_9BACT|nr:methyltransferase domain-containing protein [Desulfacinum hydrothermale]SMC20242.1 Methyltransferase domain-containing protein [Desulfacinum hydrothermale DSM 13146]